MTRNTYWQRKTQS